ncbi:MAG: SMP-30/gluconolactonase/LRE family protein [Chloroflexota bacterium]
MNLKLEVRDERLKTIFEPGAKLETVATGLEFTEGPIWHPEQKHLMFSDIQGNSIYRWSAAAGLKKYRVNSHLSNGNTYDKQGRLLTCEHASSCVSRTVLDDESTYEVLASHYYSKELNSPNDIVVKSDGMIYFTDPTSGREPMVGIPREPELSFSGVYRLNPETRELTMLVEDFAKPNGLCFSLDESQLYVNDTKRQHIRVFDVNDAGLVTGGGVFADLTGDYPGVADGMKFDSAGMLYSCGPGGVHVITAEGDVLGILLMPEHTTNFAWGEDDLKTLYITASTSVYRVRMAQPGIALF